MSKAEQSRKGRTCALTALALAGVFSTGVLMGGCGAPSAVPMDDEFAGDSGETQEHSNATSSAPRTQRKNNSQVQADTGEYRDGRYAIKGQYGPIGEDSIDVFLTVAQGQITKVSVTGHPFTSISQKHQTAFIHAIEGEVVGKPLRSLRIDVVAGASWTSAAFNKALDVARQQASINPAANK